MDYHSLAKTTVPESRTHNLNSGSLICTIKVILSDILTSVSGYTSYSGCPSVLLRRFLNVIIFNIDKVFIPGQEISEFAACQI